MRSKSSNVFAAISGTLGLSIQPQSWLRWMLKRLNSTMIHKSESWTPEDVVHDFDLNISLWCYIKPNKTGLVQNLHGPSFTKASTLSHPCTGSRPEVPELHPQNVWTQLYNWIHWDTSEGMIEWVSVGKFYASTNNFQTHFFGTCWNAWKKNCNDSNKRNMVFTKKTQKHKTNASTKQPFLSHRIA